MRARRAVAAALAVCALGAVLAWCNGFDFNHRGPAVSEAVCDIVLMAAGAAVIAAMP